MSGAGVLAHIPTALNTGYIISKYRESPAKINENKMKISVKYNFGDVNKAAIEPLYWFMRREN